MFGIGIGEIILILVIGTLVVGPDRMVAFARDAGRILAKFRRETDSVSKEFREALDLDELQGLLTEAQSEIQGVAQDLQTTRKEVQALAADTQTAIEADGTTAEAAPASTGAAAAPASATTQVAAPSRPQVTPAVLAPTLLRDGEVRSIDAQQVAEAEVDIDQPETDDAVLEVGIAQVVLEDHEVEPIVLDEPILVMDREEAEQTEEALREVAAAGIAEALEEMADPAEEVLPPEAEVAQALEEGASMVIVEPLPAEEEEDELVTPEDTVVAWETGVELVEENPQAAEPTTDPLPDEESALDGTNESKDSSTEDIDAAYSQNDAEAVESETEATPNADVKDNAELADASEGAADPTTEDDTVEGGESEG